MSIEKHLRELQKYYFENPIDEKFPEILKKELGIEIRSFYGSFQLLHPVLIAPGQLTREKSQIERIKKAGYSGCVLKSVVGENEDGNCSMAEYRKSMTYLKTVYDEENNPVIIWDGRADTRNLEEYLKFAKDAFRFSNNSFFVVASILCHLPKVDEELKKEEWIYTTKKLYEIGYKTFEIDFCPGLKNEKEIIEKENILRLYSEIPKIIKSVSNEIVVFPKLLNLDYGIEFQIKMVEAAIKGNADGIVIGNRFFRKDINSAWGGKELRERNLKVIKEIKQRYPKFFISGTGGIYSGKHILEYLKSGASNVQILSYILGRVKKPFLKQKGDKFEKVLYELYFHPSEGFLIHYLFPK